MRLEALPSVVFILLLSLNMWFVNGHSLPGKPMITNCQSSGNKTFICWWKPGSDGGLPTNYTLQYNTEGERQAYECPDYVSAGPNSCYFDKTFTSLRTTYILTVKATNDMGSNFSEPYRVDSTSLAKPDTPINLFLEVDRQSNGTRYLLAKWSLPHGALVCQNCSYELRLRPAGRKEWEIYFVGEKMEYKIFHLRPGVKYTAQVRYITDQGERSVWSSESDLRLPSGQPPGKPELIKCHSPERETFTCWWKPGSDGGLPTNHSLFYKKEGQQSFNECPDYTTAGPNSCYFSKSYTSIWITYTLIIKATNKMGSNSSKPYYVDVTFIVQLNPPVNLSAEVKKQVYKNPSVLFNWSPPPEADVKSGWLTLNYELRLKPEDGEVWENIFVGEETKYMMFNLNPGEKYIVQVRCRVDANGEWSNWSDEFYPQLPKELRMKDMLVWIFVAFLSFVICLVMIWTMALKGISVIACILPPIPGPKIAGADDLLLEPSKDEQLQWPFSCSSVTPAPDPITDISSDEGQLLMPSNGKSHPPKNIKLSPHEVDSDSGRGSCESPSLRPKCRNIKKPPMELETTVADEPQETPNSEFEQRPLYSHTGEPKSSTWPGTQLANNHIARYSYNDIVDVCKMVFSTMSVNKASTLMGKEEKSHSKYSKAIQTISEGKPTKLEEAINLPLNPQYDQGELWFLPSERSPFLPAKPMDYVEVHKVGHDGALAVLPKQKENVDKTEKYLVPGDSKEYTKVSTFVANHILVLMPDSKAEVSPLFQESPKEPSQNCQQSQAEKNMDYCLTAPNVCKMQTAGLDYMDPNNFMCPFN